MQTQTKEAIEATILNNDQNPVAVVPEEKVQVAKAVHELNANDRTSVIYFGSGAQEKLDEISNRMIDGIKNKDLGEAGGATR